MSNLPQKPSFWLRVARVCINASSPVSFVARKFIKSLGTEFSGIAHLPPDRLCIDIGAGTAPYRGVITKYLNITDYIAFDIAPSDSTSVVGDAVNMPFANGCAQVVTSFDVIQHIGDSKAVLSEVARILAPGGVFVLTFPFNYCECDVRDFRRWTLAGMEHDLRACGLEVARMEQRGGRFFALGCALTWVMQHIIPGQRNSWRANHSFSGILRAGLLYLLTLPTTATQWAMLGFDQVFPNEGCYMGGIAVAMKPTTMRRLSRAAE